MRNNNGIAFFFETDNPLGDFRFLLLFVSAVHIPHLFIYKFIISALYSGIKIQRTFRKVLSPKCTINADICQSLSQDVDVLSRKRFIHAPYGAEFSAH